MGDPHSLYVVASVVILGLLTWVAVTLLRSDAQPAAPPVRSDGPQQGAQRAAPEPAGEKPADEPRAGNR